MTSASRSLPLIAALATSTLLAGCGTSGHSSAAPTAPTSVTTGATTTIPAPTTITAPTTTVFVPAAPQPSAYAAASQLVQFWSAGERSQASSVAAPSAVAALFAVPYPGSDLAIDRGCSDAVPIVCTFGAPGGGNPNAAIYEITATQTPKGWYVTAATVEG